MEKAALALSSLGIGGVLMLAALEISLPQHYDDFVVGFATWHTSSKVQDLLAWPVFIFASFLWFWFFSATLTSLKKNHGEQFASSYATQVVLWALPLCYGLAPLILNAAIDEYAALVSIAGIVALGITGYAKRKTVQSCDPRIWGITLFLAILFALIPLEAGALISRLPVDWIGELSSRRLLNLSCALMLLGFIASVTVLRLWEEGIKRLMPKLIMGAQLGLAFFYVTLFPAQIRDADGQLAAYETAIYLTILVAGLVGVTVYDVIRRYRSVRQGGEWQPHFSPFALFALVVAIKFSSTAAPILNTDDYHFGEFLLGWWSYLQGSIPYVDYFPAHGILENDISALLASVFYEPTAVGIQHTFRVSYILLGLIAFLALYAATGSLILALVSILLLGNRFAWFFMASFVCLWLSPSLRAQPAKWLSVWLVSAPLVLLGTPPQGSVLVAAFSMLALRMAWAQLRYGDKKSWRGLAVVSVLTLIALFATPLWSMLLGAATYVLENGSINQIAYGVPWALSWAPHANPNFIFEMVRMSWVAIPVVGLYLMHAHWRDVKNLNAIFFTAAIFVAFILLLIPYPMGRVDPGHLSRPGLVSNLSWTVLFPLLTWRVAKPQNRAFILVAVASFGALIKFYPVSFANISSVTEKYVSSPALIDTAAAGLPNIGHAHVQAEHWDRLTRLKRLLEARLAKDETYLDLSSRNAHYFYMGRMPPMAVTAPYNQASPIQQRRAVEKLTANPQKLALLAADNIVHDGGGLAMRNPYLYRYVLEHYLPSMEHGFIVGHLKPQNTDVSELPLIAEIKDVSDDTWRHGYGRHVAAVVLSDSVFVSMLQAGDEIRLPDGVTRLITGTDVENSVIWLEGAPYTTLMNPPSLSVEVIAARATHQAYVASLFHRAFGISELNRLPIAWGHSAESLLERMARPTNLDELEPETHELNLDGGYYYIAGYQPSLTFNLSELGESLQGRDLLKFDFRCQNRKAEARIHVSWWGDHQDQPAPEASFQFFAAKGSLIVPLDASPLWTGLHELKGLRLDIQAPAECSAFKVSNMALYQRK